MAEEQEKPKKPFWKRYTWSLTKNDLLDFLPDQYIHCQDVRDNYYECTDRVGLMRSAAECSKFFEDYRECRYGDKLYKRLKAIAQERYKQGRPPIQKINPDHHKHQNRWNTEDM